MSSLSDPPPGNDAAPTPLVLGKRWPTTVALELEKYRHYLLSIALAELPQELHCKVGASDVVQETIVKGYEDISQFSGQSSEQLAGWLRQILLNHLTNLIRSYRADKRDISREQLFDVQAATSPQPCPSESAALQEQAEVFQAALARLNPASRLLLTLRHQDNLSFAEIATRLGKTEMTARRRWARAVQELQAELKRNDARADS